jgi:ATP-binding cassette subfamily B (MDR/TAP) protein 1
MKDGVVAEQGFRGDLMKKTPTFGNSLGVFAGMAAEQAIAPLPPEIEDRWEDSAAIEEILDGEEVMREQDHPVRGHSPSFSLRPGSVMYLDILDEYARGRFSTFDDGTSVRSSRAQKRPTWAPGNTIERHGSRSSKRSRKKSFVGSGRASIVASRHSLVNGSRNSLLVPGTPASRISRPSSNDGSPHSTRHSIREKSNHQTSRYAYEQRTLSQNLEDDLKGDFDVVVTLPDQPASAPIPSIFTLLRQHIPSMPSKHLVIIGVTGAVAHGVSTPIWSAYLAKLMQVVGTGGTSNSLTKNACIVLAISFAQGVAYFLQEYCLYAVAAIWAGGIRRTAWEAVLSQDKSWFDESENAPVRLVQILIKDADDMRALVSQVLSKFSVFISMVGLGIIWAMVIQWRLTLVGLALAPVFAGIIMANEVLIGKAEARNKAKREAVAKTFYEVSESFCLLIGEPADPIRVWQIYARSGRWR